MPLSRLRPIPHYVDILFPKFIGIACEVYVARLACITHAIAQAVNQSEAYTIIRCRWFGFFFEPGPSLEIRDLIFPIAWSHARRGLPINKHACPGIKFREQFRSRDLDRMSQLSSADNHHVRRGFLIS